MKDLGEFMEKLPYCLEWFQEAALAALNRIDEEYDGRETWEGARETIFYYLLVVVIAEHTGDQGPLERTHKMLREVLGNRFPESATLH